MKKENSLLNQSIGVFDSGVGGLSVLRALTQQLPNESFIYLGDTARLPYGTKSEQTVTHYTLKAIESLQKLSIKMLVIACNTASALALPILKQEFHQIPLIGVVEPGAQAACQTSQTGRIIVIATESTIHHQAYQKAIKQIRPEAEVIAKSCSLLVPLAEEGWTHGEITEAIVKHYLDPIFAQSAGQQADCLVLGCTHFPALIDPIHKIVDGRVKIIDSAKTTAHWVEKELQRLQLANPSQITPRKTQFLATDAPQRFSRVAERFLGMQLDNDQVELIDI